MFNGYIESFVDGIERVKNSQDDKEFQRNVNLISDYMKKQQMPVECWQRLDRLSFYETCESESETKEKWELAKDKVIDYIRMLMQGSDVPSLIEDVLENFYMFLEALKERNPHKNAGIKKEILDKINIENEYDIQFLLYAYLRPLYKGIRQEVSQDTGNETVRADLLIGENVCIEVKYSREKMTEKKLSEEIKADMLHYNQRYIYFLFTIKTKL